MSPSAEQISILAVDDNSESLFTLSSLLEHNNYRVSTASNGKEAFERVRELLPDLILMDVTMPVQDGFETTRKIREDDRFSDIPIILTTSRDHIDDIKQGLSAGANDYLKKPFTKDELLSRIEVIRRTHIVTGRGDYNDSEYKIIGESKEAKDLYETITRLKDSVASVIVTGESGTGKELAIREIHKQSKLAKKPLVIQNCSALSDTLLESELFGHIRGAFTGAIKDKKGLFEMADGGTLFLDELGEMSLPLQSKLLRVIQDGTFSPVGSTEERKVSVRVVSATHRNLEQLVQTGEFREDLYYRLHVVHIHLPPLRKRVEDIPHLIEHFLTAQYQKKLHISPEALTLLQNYRWPGNIRELQNEVERILALKEIVDTITPHHLSRKFFTEQCSSEFVKADDKILPLKDAVAKLERQLIGRALDKTGGNKSEAARLLDISRSSLIQKSKTYFESDEQQ